MSKSVRDQLEPIFGKRLATVFSLVGSVLILLGLSNVVNDVWDSIIVWYGFIKDIHILYDFIRDLFLSFFLSWWAPKVPPYIADLFIIYMALSSMFWRDGYPAFPIVFLEFVDWCLAWPLILLEKSSGPDEFIVGAFNNSFTEKLPFSIRSIFTFFPHFLSFIFYFALSPFWFALGILIFLIKTLFFAFIFIMVLPSSLLMFYNVSKKNHGMPGVGYAHRNYLAMYLTGRSVAIFLISSTVILFINYQIFKRLAVI